MVQDCVRFPPAPGAIACNDLGGRCVRCVPASHTRPPTPPHHRFLLRCQPPRPDRSLLPTARAQVQVYELTFRVHAPPARHGVCTHPATALIRPRQSQLEVACVSRGLPRSAYVPTLVAALAAPRAGQLPVARWAPEDLVVVVPRRQPLPTPTRRSPSFQPLDGEPRPLLAPRSREQGSSAGMLALKLPHGPLRPLALINCMHRAQISFPCNAIVWEASHLFGLLNQIRTPFLHFACRAARASPHASRERATQRGRDQARTFLLCWTSCVDDGPHHLVHHDVQRRGRVPA